MGAKLSVQEKEVPGEKTFIVTGANTGIGYITAKKIAQYGGRVVIACRSEEKAKQAIEQMQEENRQEVRAKRKAEREEAAKQKQKEEAAAAAKEKEEQEKKKREEAKAAAEKEREEEKKEEGEEKKEEGEEKNEEAADKPAEEETKEEEKPAEEGAKAEDKPAEEGTKEEEKPAEEGAKEDAKPEEGTKEGEGAAAEEEPEEEIPELKLQFMPLDLSSFKSTLEFVKQYKESGLPLNCLVCNAGFISPSKVITDDGLESSFQVNYLSHFLLTLYLLPLLKASPNSRIINVSSSGHKLAEGVNLDNIQAQKNFNQMKFYGNSKLFQIMNMYTLASKVKETGIDVFSVHPGVVDTQFTRGYSGITKALSFLSKGFGRNWSDGAATTLTAVLDEQYDGKGPLYFSNCKPTQPSNLARNEEKQNTLWRYSLELLREHLDDTILSEIGETLESIQPKEPEPEAAVGGDAESKKEGDEEKKEDGEKKEEEEAGGGDAGASGEAEQEEEKKEETEGDKEEEKKEE